MITAAPVGLPRWDEQHSAADCSIVITVDTVEGWAQRYIQSDDLAHKLDPEPPPRGWAEEPGALRLTGPGRPKELDVQARPKRSLRPSQLQDPRRRAQLVHTFLHHELQAAELMCWALLAIPDLMLI